MIFGTLNGLAFIHVFVTAPETKGKTLEEMDVVFDSKLKPWRAGPKGSRLDQLERDIVSGKVVVTVPGGGIACPSISSIHLDGSGMLTPSKSSFRIQSSNGILTPSRFSIRSKSSMRSIRSKSSLHSIRMDSETITPSKSLTSNTTSSIQSLKIKEDSSSMSIDSEDV